MGEENVVQWESHGGTSNLPSSTIALYAEAFPGLGRKEKIVLRCSMRQSDEGHVGDCYLTVKKSAQGARYMIY